MSESQHPFQPFRPGGPSDPAENRPPEQAEEKPSGKSPVARSSAKKESPRGEPGGRAPTGPAPFAVPEGPVEHRPLLRVSVVVPEKTEENEETLIRTPARKTGETISYLADRFEKWFVLLLFVFATLAVIVSSNDVGMSWDEAYYVEAAQKTLDWLSAGGGHGKIATAGQDLDYYWDAFNREPRGHPSVTRFLTALGLATSPTGDNGSPLAAMRWPIAVCYGLTLIFLYVLARHAYGRVTAWITVVTYFFMPNVFGFAHFATTETPMTLMSVAVVYAFLRGLERTRWALVTGVLFGLALATKINALFLLPILLPWAFLFHRREALANLYSMLFLGPLTMALAWPWMWDKPGLHFALYLVWNFQHAQIGTLFFDKVYSLATGAPPWYYSFAMIAFTLPVVTLALAAFGVARTLRVPRPHSFGLLFLWAALVPCLALIPSSAPKYDGVRLFVPAFPFIAILAGTGGAVLVRIAAFFDRPSQNLPRGQLMLLLVLVAVIIPAGRDMVAIRPHYLSYFNSLIGGIEGARDKGMEITYWGEALNRKELARLSGQIPEGATLAPLACHKLVLDLYQKWGWIKPGIRIIEPGSSAADFHLLQYRPGLFQRPEWTLYEDYTPLLTIPEKGIPMFGLYTTGPEFEQRWPQKAKK